MAQPIKDLLVVVQLAAQAPAKAVAVAVALARSGLMV